MSDHVLCVDDDPSILAAWQRSFRKRFELDVAASGDAGLRLVQERGPYAVVVADMHMPGMDGATFLARLREKAPDTVRMMLTGADDQRTAVAAVNEGQIFRFLAKPCPPELLGSALDAGIRQYRLITSERELLERTLTGSVRVLSELLSLVDPTSFGRAQQLREPIRQVMAALGASGSWEVELAAMFVPIGLITVPPVVILKSKVGRELSADERSMLDRVPEVSARLIANIPRLEVVARLVRLQTRGEGATPVEDIPMGAKVLRILRDMDQLEAEGTPRPRALDILKGRGDIYDAILLQTVLTTLAVAQPTVPPPRLKRSVNWKSLRTGQLLLSDVTTLDDKILVTAGHVITDTLLERLANFGRLGGLREPITIEEETVPRQGDTP